MALAEFATHRHDPGTMDTVSRRKSSAMPLSVKGRLDSRK
jgi:hypothetical protein